MRSISLLTLIFIILLGCSERDRINPLDPANETTKGKISGVSIIAKERSIFLSWNRLNLVDLDSIKIYRQVDSGELVFYRSVDPGINSFIETHVQYGKTYRYAVTAAAGNYETPLSTIVETIPGPTYLWVGNVTDGMVSRLTHDLSAVVISFGPLRYPDIIVPIPRERAGWCFSLFSDVLYKIDELGRRELFITELGRLTDMDADTSRRELWATNVVNGTLWRIATTGEILSEFHSVSHPSQIAVDGRRHIAWVIDEEEKHVYRVSRSGFVSARSQQPLNEPMDVAVDADINAIWIADKNRVVQLDGSGKELLSVSGFADASKIDVDTIRKNVWVVDRGSSAGQAAVVKLNIKGEIQFRLQSFVSPVEIDVNQFDGSCFVADPGRRDLFRISENGSDISTVGNFRSPQAVAVEHH